MATVPVATCTQCSRSINGTVGNILNVVCCLTDTLDGCVSETPAGVLLRKQPRRH